MGLRNAGLALASLLLFTSAQADVMYQCIDENGHKSFSNMKSTAKGTRCTAMNLGETLSTVPAQKPARRTDAPTPSTFPKVDEGTQRTRDNDRRKILEGELAAEQNNLAQAKKELSEQENTRNGNERNYQKALDRIQPYKDKVALHERNIEAIEKEISKLR